jgi:putative restriction endonuclease
VYAPELDEDVRTSCFLALDVLRATFGDAIPYRSGLDAGFAFRGERVPFLNPQKGIHRARVQRGPAALAIVTSFRSPYADEETDLGLVYAYRAGDIDQADNRALRAAELLRVPLVYFLATRPGWYQAEYPCFVEEDRPDERAVLVSRGRMVGPMDDREPQPIEDPVERRYAVRETRVRLHQGRFRGLVVRAYRDRCTICRLREVRLLDAAHIVRDLEPRGEPMIPNGLSLCSIHHRAYDQNLVGISPDYRVRLAPRLLDEDDGPMLELLKGAQDATIVLPSRAEWQPDPERLAARFDAFVRSSG